MTPFLRRVSGSLRRRFDRAFPIPAVNANEATDVHWGKPFLAAEHLKVTAPQTSLPTVALELPSRECLFVERGTIWPENGVVADRHGRAITETAWAPDRFAKHQLIGSFARFPVITSGAKAATAIDYGGWWNNYGHVVLEALPRILGLHSPECLQLDSVDVHICSLAAPHWRPLLEALIPPNARLCPSPANSRVRCHSVIALPVISGDIVGFIRGEWLSRFRAAATRAWGPADASQPRKIYVSRRQATHRRILNEAELIASLRSFGFVAVALESLSLAEQYKLFATAEVVVAPHGAGLTNLIHAPAGCSLVELFPDDPSLERHYRWLSHSCQQSYTCWSANVFGIHTDFMVDIDAVVAMATRKSTA